MSKCSKTTVNINNFVNKVVNNWYKFHMQQKSDVKVYQLKLTVSILKSQKVKISHFNTLTTIGITQTLTTTFIIQVLLHAVSSIRRIS